MLAFAASEICLTNEISCVSKPSLESRYSVSEFRGRVFAVPFKTEVAIMPTPCRACDMPSVENIQLLRFPLLYRPQCALFQFIFVDLAVAVWCGHHQEKDLRC